MIEDANSVNSIIQIKKNMGTHKSNEAPNVKNDAIMAMKWPTNAIITKGMEMIKTAKSIDIDWMRQKLRHLSFLSFDAKYAIADTTKPKI
jgi:hypothetical protein